MSLCHSDPPKTSQFLPSNTASILGWGLYICSRLGVAVNSIQVVRGTQSRERGGTSYKPTYILDAVLLSEHIHCMDDMKQVVTEHLAPFVFFLDDHFVNV